MSIDGVNGRTSYIGTSILNIRAQLDNLTQQLASGRVSTTYAGQGANRGFALSLRAQVSGLDSYADTAKNVNIRLNVVNLALQGLSDIGTSVKSAASTSTVVLNNNFMAAETHAMHASHERYGTMNILGNYADLAKSLGGWVQPRKISLYFAVGVQWC